MAPASLALCATLASAGLVGLHGETRSSDLLSVSQIDAVRIAFLRANIASEPLDFELRERLVRALHSVGAWQDAERTLAPLLEREGAPSPEVLRLAVEIGTARWRSTFNGSHARATAERRLVSLLQRFMHGHTGPVDYAFAFERARAIGRPDVAADLAVHAFEAAGTRASAALGLATLDALLAADEGGAALQLAEQLARRWARDAEVMARAHEIALAQNDPHRARRFGAGLIALGAANEITLRRQFDLALGESDVMDAAAVARRLVALRPHDISARLTAANAAAWAGLYRISLRHFLWIARHASHPLATSRALQIARELDEPELVADLLLLQSRRAPLTGEQLTELARSISRSRSMTAAAAALAEHAARHPRERAAWEALADFEERAENFAAAIAARREIEQRFGASRAGSVQLARLLWLDGHTEEALDTLRPWAARAGSDAAYWHLAADLAWDLEQPELAMRACRVLWEAGDSSAWVAERLVVLERDAGRSALAIRHAREAWRRTRAPRLLLLAIDEAARTERWAVVGPLLAEADGAANVFAAQPLYWMIRARFEERRQNIAAAASAYRQALQVDPASPDVRASMVWLYVAAKDDLALAPLVDEWGADPAPAPQLARALAAARNYLERDAGWDTQQPWALASVDWNTQSFGPLQAHRTRFRLRGGAPMLGGTTEASVGLARQDEDAFVDTAVSHTRTLAPGLSVRMEGVLDEPADESAALLLDGERTRAGATLHSRGERLYASVGGEWRTWSDRSGERLARGAIGTAEVGTLLRSADPALRVAIVGSYQRNQMRSDGTLLPEELLLAGAVAGVSDWRVGAARIFADAFVGMMSQPLRPATRFQAGVAFAPFRSAEVSVTAFLANDRWNDARSDFGVSASLSYRFRGIR